MASETKVGLIAGLTFIICFAVILANRGTRELAPQSEYRIAGPRGSASGDWQIRSQPAAVQVPPSPTAPTARGVDSPSRRPVHAPRRPADPRRIDRPTDQGADPEFESTTVAQAEPISPDHPASAQVHGTSLTSTSHDPDSRLKLLKRRLDELAEDLEAAGKSNTVRVEGSEPKPARADVQEPASSAPSGRANMPSLARYTVVSGDTLSKIAGAHYGRRSTRFVNAIFDANRSVLSSPDVLRPGMELVIPAVEGATAPSSAESSGERETKTPRPPRSNRQDSQPPYRWYQIKKNDRYMSIAREQLGDARRWPEIYELNKEKFPDPGMIREGVRIKIPVQALAASTERRR
ncbi:MAG: LysM peptidoglycan-binding domain-containing protein [Planctomycetota bacterium]|jgi:nucleoid-associated protein YgaU